MSDTTIRVTSDTDSVLFTGDDIGAGYIYNNASLDEWYSTPDASVDTEQRPNAHGDYSPDQTYMPGTSIPFEGKFFGGFDRMVAAVARTRLTGLYNDGKPVTVQVVDPLMTTTRTGFIRHVDVPWNPHPQFDWSFELYAPDPRRYGPSQTYGPVALPSASSGLVWPLGTAATGRYWEWGTIANLGQITITNTGNTPSYPLLQVGAGGRFTSGFRVVEVETGRALSYAAATNTNDVITLNNRTRRAQINGTSDATQNLVIRQWFSIPPGATRRYQLATLGTVTGSPTLSATVSTPFL